MQITKPLVVHLIYQLGTGGLERVMLNCIQALPEYNHAVISLTTADDFAKQLPAGMQVYCLNKMPGTDFKTHWRLFKILRRLKADILHSYNIATLEYQPVALLAGIKGRVHAEHGRDIYDPEGKIKKYQWLRRLISPFLHSFITVSADLQQWLISQVKIKPSKVQLIYNGVNTERFSPAYTHNPSFTFIHIARLAAIKDQGTLLQAAALLQQQKPTGWKLLIIGDGPMAAELHGMHEMLQLPQVEFLGNRSDISQLLQAADSFVLSSLAEGIPMTILEAMASGIAIIATDVGGIPEIVKPNYGILVPAKTAETLAKAMLSHVENADKTRTQGLAARTAAVDNFSETRMIASYRRLYQNLLN